MDEPSESTDTVVNERDAATSRNSRQRKRAGWCLSPEDFHQLGIFNQGYQNEIIGTQIRGSER